MAFVKINNVALKGVSVCAPSTIEENGEYPYYEGDEYRRTLPTLGVERRHVLKRGQTCADLAIKAAEKLLKDLGWDKESVGLLVFCSPARDYILPDTACLIQDRLGLSSTTMAFDMTLGCTGWVYGLTTVSSILQTGCIKRALLLNGNMGSAENAVTDKSAYPLAGDMGSATALEFDINVAPIWCELGTEGSKSIKIPEGGRRQPLTEDSLLLKEYDGNVRRSNVHIFMDGMDVFSFDLKTAPASFESVLEFANQKKEDFDFFLFQQSSYYAVKKIIKKLKLPVERVPLALRNYGTTGASCIPLTIVTELSDQIRNGKYNLLACSFGVGFSWASACFTVNNLIVSELQYLD